MTLSQIDQALVEQLTDGGYARVTIQGLACDLRSFFSYAESKGWCRVGLAAGIKGPRIYSQESIPAGPSWDDVLKLLAQTDGDRAVDIRDRALLMLLAHYGLRAGEVRRLRLEDFDWQNERLSSHSRQDAVRPDLPAGATGRRRCSPLSQGSSSPLDPSRSLSHYPPTFPPTGGRSRERVGISALAGLGHFAASLRLTHSAPCVCHAPLWRKASP